MRKFKLFWAWDFDKEERWLNEMSAQGWQFRKYHFFWYDFEKGAPNEYRYRLEMLDELPSSQKSRQYLDFLAETGVEKVDSYLRWVYLRRPAALGEFNLFSDLDSRIRHLKRIRALLAIPALLMVVNLINVVQLLLRGLGFSLLEAGTLAGALALMILLGLLVFGGLAQIHNQLTILQRERSIHE